MKPRLTQTEQSVVERYRRQPRPLRWAEHFIYVFPSFLFAILGMARADYVALLVAWGVLLGYGIYVVHAQYREADLLRGVFRKFGRGAKGRKA